MSVLSQVVGLPGVRASKTALHRLVFRGGWMPDIFPQGKIVQSGKARDPGNAATPTVLRPGTLMGIISATGKYGATILGVTTGAYTSGGTSLTVSPAQAVEIVRRVGSSGTGTLKAIGPPTAAGTVATTAITYSAVNTTTGVITVTSLGVDKVAGTLITAADGSQVPNTIIPDGFGLKVTDYDGNDLDTPFAELPISGIIDVNQILPSYPADTSIQAYIKASLSTASGGKFIFSDAF